MRLDMDKRFLRLSVNQKVNEAKQGIHYERPPRIGSGYRVLEVGWGSSWHTLTVAEIVAPTDVADEKWGHVHTIEITTELAELTHRNIEKAGIGDRVNVICKDGSKGFPLIAPYDRILVTAAAPDVPKPLIEQLKEGGVLVVPVGGIQQYQILFRVRKKDGG